MEGLKFPTEDVDTKDLDKKKRTPEESDEGEFVVDEEGFVSFENLLKKIREEGNGEIIEEAA